MGAGYLEVRVIRAHGECGAEVQIIMENIGLLE